MLGQLNPPPPPVGIADSWCIANNTVYPPDVKTFRGKKQQKAEQWTSWSGSSLAKKSTVSPPSFYAAAL
jgi:hypothetical protein